MDTMQSSAQERIKAAFLSALSNMRPTKQEIAFSLRIGKILNSHFKTYCSFYDPKLMLSLPKKANELFGKTLLGVSDYHKISITALAKEAGVNRGTFYKLYPNIDALYEDCCKDEIERFLAVEIPAEKTPETMLKYGSALWRVMKERFSTLFLLSHHVGNRTLVYSIGRALYTKLSASLSTEERVSFGVKGNLQTFPELYSTWLGLIPIDALAPDVFPDQNLPVYDTSLSFIENVARLFENRYGGDAQTYYAFGLAALKLISTERSLFDISITEFCEAAGYVRATFYLHFKDAADYYAKVMENMVLVCVSSFYYFLDHPEELTPQNLQTFRKEMRGFPLEGIRHIFINGGISYLMPATFAYLVRMLKHRMREMHIPVNKRTTALLYYYISYALRLFTMYYLNEMNDAELALKGKTLERIKERIRSVSTSDGTVQTK